MNRTDVSLISLLPVDFGWEIITMVREDPGSQLLFLPDHSHSPLFWHIKPGKAIQSLNALQHCGFSLWTTASSSFSQISLHACSLLPTPPNRKEQGGGWAVGLADLTASLQPQELCCCLLYEMTYWASLLWRVLLWNSWNHMLSGVHILQLPILIGLRQLHLNFLFSIHCTSKCK